MQYSFCPKCGSHLTLQTIDAIERMVCSRCTFIFYENSKPCAAALVLKSGQVLLVQRAVNPFKGYWDIPGGFLEAGEHPRAGAIREIAEETGLKIKLTAELGIFMSVYGQSGEHTLNICYVAEVIAGEAQAGSDASSLGWFDLQALPQKIAFPDWSNKALTLLQQRYSCPEDIL